VLLALLLSAPLAAVAAEEGAEHGEGGSDTLATVFKWVNFVMVFGAGGYLLRKPLAAAFAGQRAAIQNAIGEARQAREQSEARLKEIEQRLARLGEEVEALRREAATAAAAERERLQDAARREAERILATAQAEIDSAGRAARIELRAYGARLAVTLAEDRLRRQLTPESHAALFETALNQMAAGARR
jgi:F0F1-type ATP synthase membrane subunit b/b'